MSHFIDQLAQQAAASGLQAAQSGIFGMILGKAQDKRQLKQQEKLQKLQIAGSKELTDYQKMKELEMWKATSFGPQMEQLKAAGLNPGLIYGMNGAGGATTGGGAAATPTGATATQAAGGEFGLAMQLGMMTAQKKLIESQAANLDADTANKAGGQKNLLETQIRDLTQGIENKKAEQRLTTLRADMQELDNELKGKTLQDQIEITGYETQRVLAEVERLVRQNIIDKATMNNRIQIVKEDLAGIILRNALTSAQTDTEKGKPALQAAEISKIITEMQGIIRSGVQRWLELEYQGIKMNDERRAAEERNFEEQIKNTTGLPIEIIKTVVQGIIFKGILEGKQPTPIRGLHERN